MEKRRFNRIDVSLAAVVEPVDMDLNVLSGVAPIDGMVVNLSPIGMAIYTPASLRAGARYRVTLSLPNEKTCLFALVKHVAVVDNGTRYSYASGMQVVGATQDDLIEVVKFLAIAARTQKM